MKIFIIHCTKVVAGLAIASSFLTVSCQKEDEQKNEIPSYQTMVLKLTDKVLDTNHVAIVRGRQNVEIRPQISGTITDIRVEEGGIVQKDQVLFIIDQAPYIAAIKIADANVKTAQAKLSTARLTADSKDVLHKANVIADFDLQTARNALQESEAALELALAQKSNAETELSYTEIKSPVNGVASMIPYRIGALVDNNIEEPLITVSDDEEVYAYFSMTENQMLNIIQKQGSPENLIHNAAEVRLRLGNGTLYAHPGKIDAVSGTIDPNTGTVSVRAIFPNPEKLLRNGSTGQLILSTQHTDCIVIPQSATYEIQNRIFVYKVVDRIAVSTPVQVENIHDGKEYIVTSGLKEGDTIITEGAGLVREGTVVSNSSNH